MSYALEVYYKPPANLNREMALLQYVFEFGGSLDYREEPDGGTPGSICLTFEFADFEQAAAAADSLRQRGEQVEGPQDYGP